MRKRKKKKKNKKINSILFKKQCNFIPHKKEKQKKQKENTQK